MIYIRPEHQFANPAKVWMGGYCLNLGNDAQGTLKWSFGKDVGK